jgi:hypothetical protein
LQPNAAVLACKFLDHLTGAVVRGVVGDDHLQVDVDLAERRRDGVGEHFGSLVAGDAHTD